MRGVVAGLMATLPTNKAITIAPACAAVHPSPTCRNSARRKVDDRSAECFHADHEGGDAERGEGESGAVERAGALGADVGHDPSPHEEACDAERHVDQEDPPPGRVGAEDATEGGGNDGGDQRGPGQVSDGCDQFGLGGSA
jgi:hypothetical protein